MPAGRYPKAIWLGDGFVSGSYSGGPWKIVLHTTETAGVPGYANGRSAPHVTYYARTRKFFQHIDFNKPARALRDPTDGVDQNGDQEIQLEIVAYSAEGVVDKYPNTGRVKVSELSADQLADIGGFIDWVSDEFGVKKKWPFRKATSYAGANAPGFRMTPAEYNKYDGILGHQHVPGNFHWDPGNLDWNALLTEEDVNLDAQDLAAIKQLLDKHDEVFEYTNSAGQKLRMSGLGVSSSWRVDIGGRRAMDWLPVIGKAHAAALQDDQIDVVTFAAAVREGLGEEIALAIGHALVGTVE